MRRLVMLLTLVLLCRPVWLAAASDEAVIASFEPTEPVTLGLRRATGSGDP